MRGLQRYSIPVIFMCLVAPVVLAQESTRKPVAEPAASQKADAETQEAILLMVSIISAELDVRLNALDSSKGKDGTEKLAALYAKTARSPIASRMLVSRLVGEYTGNRTNAQSAPQVSQVADETGIKFQMLIIAQNQRIIELLEQIAKKRL